MNNEVDLTDLQDRGLGSSLEETNLPISWPSPEEQSSPIGWSRPRATSLPIASGRSIPQRTYSPIGWSSATQGHSSTLRKRGNATPDTLQDDLDEYVMISATSHCFATNLYPGDAVRGFSPWTKLVMGGCRLKIWLLVRTPSDPFTGSALLLYRQCALE